MFHCLIIFYASLQNELVHKNLIIDYTWLRYIFVLLTIYMYCITNIGEQIYCTK